MRIWDIAPGKLCRNHFLGEHRELHAIWSILTKQGAGEDIEEKEVRLQGVRKTGEDI